MRTNGVVAFNPYFAMLFLISAAGMTLVWLIIRPHGIGLSPDSVGYISIARNLISGKGAIDFYNKPFVIQPPLYPGVLATLSILFSKDPLLVAPYLNAALFGLTVFLSGWLLFLYLPERIVCVYGTILTILSVPLLGVSQMAWSELLFIVFTLLFFLFLNRYLTTKRGIMLLLSALAVSAASLTRYAGIVLIPTGLLALLFFANKNNSFQMIKTLASFTLISTFPLGLWLFRNYLFSNTWVGPRAPSQYTLSQNLLFTMETYFKWFLPNYVVERERWLLFSVSGLGILSAFFVPWKQTEGHWSMTIPKPTQLALIFFLFFYIGLVIAASTLSALDQIGTRLLAPTYVPLVIVILGTLSSVYKNEKGWKTVSSIVLGLAAVIMLGKPLKATIDAFKKKDGIGYNSRRWRESSTIQFLQEHSHLVGCSPIYSNEPEALYIVANLSASLSPVKREYNSPPNRNRTIRDLRGNWPDQNGAILVWFENSDRNYLFTREEVLSITDSTLLFRSEDGLVYKLFHVPSKH